MSPLTIIVLIILIAISLLFVLRAQIVRMMHWGLHLLFPVMVIICLTALFVPQLYDTVADNSLKAWGTYQTVVNIDQGIDDALATPQGILNGIQSLFGGATNENEDFDFAQTEVYPGLVAGISGIYRTLAIVLSLVAMALILYLSYSTDGAYTAAKLDHKVKQLEKRLAALEGPK